jgi:hypothetical protein
LVERQVFEIAAGDFVSSFDQFGSRHKRGWGHRCVTCSGWGWGGDEDRRSRGSVHWLGAKAKDRGGGAPVGMWTTLLRCPHTHRRSPVPGKGTNTRSDRPTRKRPCAFAETEPTTLVGLLAKVIHAVEIVDRPAFEDEIGGMNNRLRKSEDRDLGVRNG